MTGDAVVAAIAAQPVGERRAREVLDACKGIDAGSDGFLRAIARLSRAGQDVRRAVAGARRAPPLTDRNLLFYDNF